MSAETQELLHFQSLRPRYASHHFQTYEKSPASFPETRFSNRDAMVFRVSTNYRSCMFSDVPNAKLDTARIWLSSYRRNGDI
jgi:hypothetical protein